MPRPRFRFRLLFGLLLSGALHGAETKGMPRVRFLAERTPPNLGQVVMAVDKNLSKPFMLPMNNLSDAMEAPARAFQLRPQQAETPLATVTLPETGDSFVAILVPGKTDYQVIVIPAADASFRNGDVYFHNHTDQEVIGYVGTTKFTLAAGKGQVVKPAGAKDGGYYDVAFGVKEEAGNRTLSTTRWPVEEQSRSYVFFFNNPANGRIEFRAVDEFVPAVKPGEAKAPAPARE